MTQHAAFQATIHGFKTIPSRGVVSITVEAPIEHLVEIARIAEHGAWVAVARLTAPPAETEQPSADDERRRWPQLQPAAQAAIRCDDPIFRAFLKEVHEQECADSDGAAVAVRQLCCVESRKELATNHKARVLWHQLDSQFQAWARV